MLRTLFLIHFFWLIYCHVLSKALADLLNVSENPRDWLTDQSNYTNDSVVPPRTAAITGDTIITGHGYGVEVHSVVTRDNEGFTLKIFRISSSPHCKNWGVKPAVLLNHGMTASADSWLIMGPRNGLPYLLADACYDVWLTNCRGTRYSKGRKPKIAGLLSFWDFSWHEIGTEDLPVIIDHILHTTKQSALHFVGHSQGTTTLMVLLSMRPEYNVKIKTAQLLAPAVFMRHSLTLIQKLLSPILKLMPDIELVPHLSVLSTFISALCKVSGFKQVCTAMYLLSGGKVSKHMDRSIVPLLLATHPNGISPRQPKHFFQLKDSGRFQQYDFGSLKNMLRYKKRSPPIYPLQNVRPLSPIHLYYSEDDGTVSPKDVLTLTNHLCHTVVHHHITERTFDHTDFLFATTVNRMINTPVMNVIQQYESNHKNG
ncbi:lipase 3 [Drosophila ficusphila]|uniref:lipase 3 n=1 Tax=Drosophila ficusphila TaxID=30025 RepID=UPI0007E8A3FF|nr:lipase 3 [Drosophila ficusphila]